MPNNDRIPKNNDRMLKAVLPRPEYHGIKGNMGERMSYQDGLDFMRGFLIIHNAANKNLDREKQFHYIHNMFTPIMVILKAVLKAAWQCIAVAEGGFY